MVLVAQATVPNAFKEWQADPVELGGLERTIIPSSGEWECLAGGGNKRATIDPPDPSFNDSLLDGWRPAYHALSRRGVPYGPVISLPKADQLCPSKGGPAGIQPCDQTWAAEEMYDESEDARAFRRSVDEVDLFDPEWHNVTERGVDVADLDLHQLVARHDKKPLDICVGHAKMVVKFPDYDTNGDILDNPAWNDCFNCTLASHKPLSLSPALPGFLVKT